MKEKFIPAARYHFLTPLFDLGCSFFGLGRKYRQSIIAIMNLPTQQLHVLDAGCGSGSLAIEVKQAFPNLELYAIDADTNILEIARRKSAEKKQELYFRTAFLQKLPFPDNSFDYVYSSLVFHHLVTDLKNEAMKEIRRVLKKNGRFLLIDFGKPKNKFVSFFSWFTVVFEEGYDNYKGKLPSMLSSAGFCKVKKVQNYRFNIEMIEAVK